MSRLWYIPFRCLIRNNPVVCLSLFILVMIHIVSADDYGTWNYSTDIILNTSATGANISGDVLGFPVLIHLNPDNFADFINTNAGGTDIRFAKTDGTHLPYQIERWVDGAGDLDTAEIWVKPDTVYGNNITQKIVMYWGNVGAADSSNSGAVFETGNGFLGTYHLGGDLTDATVNGYHGTDNGTTDIADGIIGHARGFDGSTQYFHVGDIADRTSGSISCWFKPNVTFNSSSATSQGLYGKYTDASYSVTLTLRGADFLLGDGATGELQTKNENNNVSSYVSSSTNSFSAGTWYYVTWTWGNGSDTMFVNGTIEGIAASSETMTGSGNDEVGRSYYDDGNVSGGGPGYFNGSIDEFRIENTSRSLDWIKLSYENQKSGQTLVEITTPVDDYTWDISSSSGIQAGSGTWGVNSYWTQTSGDGTLLTAWPGAGNSAVFAGADGSYTITVSGTQYIDSLTFLNNGYILSGGTAIDLGSGKGIYVEAGKIATIATPVNGTAGLTKSGAGQLTLSGVNTYTGNTVVKEGVLDLNGGSIASGSAVTVENGAAFNGTGTVNGALTVNGFFTPAGTGTGMFNAAGGLTLSSTGDCMFDIIGMSTPGTDYDQIAVTGSVTLGSALLNVTLGYTPSVNDTFIIISNDAADAVSGTFGGLPQGGDIIVGYGGSAYRFSINYIGGDGNDVVLTCTEEVIDYTWDTDPGAGITAASGDWDGSTTNWTVSSGDGTSLVIWPGAGKTATFAGTNGTYTINVIGTQYADSLTFLNDGYVLSGGTSIDLGTKKGIYVGSGATATLSMPVAGTGGLSKSGDGILVLDGSNTFTGTMSINEGTLRLGASGSLSGTDALVLSNDASAVLDLNGNNGTVGSIAGGGSSGGNITLGVGQFTVGTDNTSTTFAGIISGTGMVTKQGTGTLTLTGSNTYTGTTTITSGTLQIGDGGTTGEVVSDITATTELVFNRSNPYTYSGIISGAGSVTQSGSGTIILTGANTWTGTTTVDAGGTLQIGDGATDGNITSGITNSGTVAFSPLSSINYSNMITGTGSLTKTGPGVLTLAGSNTYTGGTTVNDGTLQIGDGSSMGSITGDISNNATVDFNRGDGITFSGIISGTGAVTVSGYSLTLTGENTYTGGTTANSGTLVVGDGSTMGSVAGDIVNNYSVQFNRMDAVTYGGSISGTGTMEKLGSGTLILTGANTYTGNTTVTSGTLQIGNGGTTGEVISDITATTALVFDRSDPYTYSGIISGAGSVTQSGSGTLILTGANTWYGGTTVDTGGTLQIGDGGMTGEITSGTLSNSGILVFNRSDAVSYSGTITGTGSLTKSGTGTLTLSGTNTYSGGTTVSGGILQIGDGSSMGSIDGNISNDATVVFNRGDGLTYSGVISGAGSVTHDGYSTLTLTGENTYTGATMVNNGTLIIGDGSSMGSVTGDIINNNSVRFNRMDNVTYSGVISGTGTVEQMGSGTLILTGANTGSGNFTVTTGTLQIGDGGSSGEVVSDITTTTALVFNRSDSYTYSGFISGAGSVTQSGSGMLILSGTNTYTGTTTVSGGTLLVNGSITSGSGVTVDAGYTLQVGDGGSTGEISNNISNEGMVVFNRSDASSYSYSITGSGSLEKSGTGTLTLSGTNTHTGGTTVSGGTLQIGDGSSMGSIAGDINNDATVVFNRGDGMTFSGVISGTGSVTHDGYSTLTLTSNNTYSGATTVNNSMLVIGDGSTMGSVAGDIVNNNSVQFNRMDNVTYSGIISGTGTVEQMGSGTLILTGANTGSGNFTVTTGTLQIGDGGASGEVLSDITTTTALVFNRSDSYTYSGVISGAGSVTQSGSGTLTLGGTNTYTGATSVSGGTLLVNGSIASGSGVTVDAGGTLQVGDGGTTGEVTNNISNEGIVVFNRSDSISYSGVISGSGGLTKSGTGTLTLDGAHTYTGSTYVSEGTLTISGSGSIASGSAVTIQSGATLGGTGTVYGALSVYGNFAPGTSPGTINAAGGLTFSGSGTCTVEINGSATPGTDYDQIMVTGGVTLDSALLDVVLGYAPTVSDAYTIIDNDGADAVSGTFSGIAEGATVNVPYSTSMYQFSISYAGGDGNDVVLTCEGELTDYTWDTQSSSGMQEGGGTWGTDNFWSVTGSDGMSPTAWPGMGYSATFTGADASYTVTVNTTQYVDSLTFEADGYLLDGGTLEFGSSTKGVSVASGKTAMISSIVNGSGGMEKSGDGTLVLRGANTYTGGTTISAGTLAIGNGGAEGSISGDVVNGGTLVFNRSNAVTFSNSISGSGSVTKSGTGTLTLTGTNTYIGGTTVDSGTLQIGDGSSMGSIGGDIVNNATIVFNRGDGIIYSGIISGSGTVTQNGYSLTLTGNNTYTGVTTVNSGTLILGDGTNLGNVAGDIINYSTVRFNYDDPGTYSGMISDVGTVEKTGTSTLILAGANTGTGTITVSMGSLQIGDGATSGSISANVINNTEVIFNRTDASTYTGDLTGTGSVTKSGTGTLTLTGGLAHSGGTIINTGTFQIGNGGNSGSVTGNINNSGAVEFNRSDDTTYSAVVSGSGTLTKSGTGRLTLDNTNTYTGATIVSEGTLFLGPSGSLASQSAVTVESNGVIGGTGVANGTVTITGVLSPGMDAPGELTVGNLVVDSAAVMECQIGTVWDQVAVNGNLTLDGTLNVNTETGFSAGTYQIFSCSGTLTDNGMEIGSVPPGYEYAINSGAGIVELAITEIPMREWIGGGGDNLWSNPANWSGSVAPTSVDSVIFMSASYPCDLDVDVTVKCLMMESGFTQDLNLNGYKLTVLRQLSVSSAGNIICSGGDIIAFGGTDPMLFEPKSGMSFTTISQEGTGTTTVQGNGFTVNTLAISDGAFDCGAGLTHAINDTLYINGGSMTLGSSTVLITGGLVTGGGSLAFSRGTLRFAGTGAKADFSLLTTLSLDTGKIEFNGTGAGLFTLSTASGHTCPSLRINGTSTDTVRFLTDVNAKSILQTSSILDCGTGLTHTIDTVDCSAGGEIDFGGASIAVSFADANLSGLSNITVTTGMLVFTAPSGTQQFTPPSALSCPPIVKNGAGMLQLQTNSLTCQGLSILDGVFDFNALNVTVNGDFTVTGGTASTFTGLDGRNISVSGNVALGGQSGNLLNLNSSTAWSISANGSLSADYATVGNSDASGGSAVGYALVNCVDNGGNTAWYFDTAAPDNDMTLEVTTLSTTSLQLSWNPEMVDSADGEAVGIWYKLSDPPDSANDVTATYAGEFSLTGSPQTITGLNSGTKYYFAMAVRDEYSNWSGVTAAAVDSEYTFAYPPTAVNGPGTVYTNTIPLTWTNPSGLTPTDSIYIHYDTTTGALGWIYDTTLSYDQSTCDATLPLSGEGAWRVMISTSYDSAGVHHIEDVLVYDFIYQVDPPVLTSDAGTTPRRKISVSFTTPAGLTTDDSIYIHRDTIDGSTWTIDTTVGSAVTSIDILLPAAEGVYRYAVSTSLDSLGVLDADNMALDTVTLEITPPVISTENDTVEDLTPAVTWSAPAGMTTGDTFYIFTDTVTGTNGWGRFGMYEYPEDSTNLSFSGIGRYIYRITTSFDSLAEIEASNGAVDTITIVDNLPPSGGSLTISDHNGYTSDATPPLTIEATNVDSMRMALAGDTTNAVWKAFASPDSIDISAGGEGKIFIFVQFMDLAGNRTEWLFDTTIYDTTAPTGTVTVTGTMSDADPSLSLTATGADSMRIALEADSGTSTWRQFVSVDSIDISAGGEGEKIICVQYIDFAGNRSPWYSATTMYDVTAPTGSIAIQDKEGYTADTKLPLVITAAGADSMQVALSTDGTGAIWKVLSVSDTVSHTSVEGPVEVFVQFKDTSGNVSAWSVDTTVYDSTSPATVVEISGSYGSTTWPDTIKGTSEDALSGIDSIFITVYRFSDTSWWDGTAWQSMETSHITAGNEGWSIYLPDTNLTGGEYILAVTAKDRAGNITVPADSVKFSYYRKPEAIFSASADTGAAPLTVSFIDNTTDSVSSYLWNFDDGTTGTESDPVHIFDSVGTYQVSLAVIGPGGSDTSESVYITVTDTTKPSAITNLALQAVSCSTLTIEWYPSESEDADSVILVALFLPGTDDTVDTVDTVATVTVSNEVSTKQIGNVPPSGGIVNIFGKVKDRYGNTSAETNASTVVPDCQAPIYVIETVVGKHGDSVVVVTIAFDESTAEAGVMKVGMGFSRDTAIFTQEELPLRDTIISSEVIREFGWWYVVTAQSDSSGNWSSNAVDSIYLENTPPELHMVGDTTIDEETVWKYNVEVNDRNGDSITLSSVSKPQGCVLENGVIQWQPDDEHVGTSPLIVVADDGNGGRTFDTTYITVRNRAEVPVIEYVGDTNAIEDQKFTAAIKISDPDNDDTHIITDLALPSWMLRSGSSLEGIPREPDAGNDTIKIVVIDSYGLGDTLEMAINVQSVNDTPVVVTYTLPDTIGEHDSLLSEIIVEDSDEHDSLVVVWITSCRWLSAEVPRRDTGSNRWSIKVHGQPEQSDTGYNKFIVAFKDKEGASAFIDGNVFVQDQDDPPSAPILSREVAFGAVRYSMHAIDDRDRELIYAVQLIRVNDTAVYFIDRSSAGRFAIYPLPDGHYRFSAVAIDQAGFASDTTFDTLVIERATRHISADTGWSMFSIPGKYATNRLKQTEYLLHWDESIDEKQLYHYYLQKHEIEMLYPGLGYWRKGTSADTVSLGEADIVKKPVTVSLLNSAAGWNQIGCPFPYPVVWKEKDAVIWRWNDKENDFEESDSVLEPWQAYWIHSDSEKDILIDTIPHFTDKRLAKRKKTWFAGKTNWVLRMILNTSGGKDADNRIGIVPDARDGYDRYDRPEPPRMNDKAYMYIPHNDWKRGLSEFAVDIRKKWLPINIFEIGINAGSTNGIAKVSFEGYAQNAAVYLFMKTSDSIVPIDPQEGIAVKLEDRPIFRTLFVVDNPQVLNSLPLRFSLGSPYPNPFCPATKIRYILPYRWESNGRLLSGDYVVRMDIIDLRGRKIRNIIHRKMAPGTYETFWDGKSQSGRIVASGHYFCRLQAGPFMSVKKMTLLR